MKELNFIVEMLKELNIKEEKNANGINMFESVNETEKQVFAEAGLVLASPVILTVYLMSQQNPLGGILLLTGIYGHLFLVAVTGGGGAFVAGLIHLGFCIYKNIKKKVNILD